MWASERQAQNAADAGALVGRAIAAASTRVTDQTRARRPSPSRERHRISGPAHRHNVSDVTFPLVPARRRSTRRHGCIRVDVSPTRTCNPRRRFSRGWPMCNSQGVRATATAMAGAGNSRRLHAPVGCRRQVDRQLGAPGRTRPAWDQMDDIRTRRRHVRR